MNAPKHARIAQLELKDSKLFRQQCYIDGAWLDADDKSTIAVKNPADGAALGTVPKMGVAETRRAIAAANAAFPAWRAKTAKERSIILRRWFELMMANQEDLAQIALVTGPGSRGSRATRLGATTILPRSEICSQDFADAAGKTRWCESLPPRRACQRRSAVTTRCETGPSLSIL